MSTRSRLIRGLLLIAVGGLAGYLIYNTARDNAPSRKHDVAFYTVDDGVTSFIDRANREPPFDHEGAEAVRVRYFTCDGGQSRFVGWLEKYAPEAKVILDSASHDGDGNLKDPSATWAALGWNRRPMVKRPSDARWILPHEEEWYDKITTPLCPPGADESQLAPVEAK